MARPAAALLERVPRHQRYLYEVGKLLASTEGLDAAVPSVLELLADGLALRTVVLVIEDDDGGWQTSARDTPATPPDAVAAATARASATLAYMAGYDPVRQADLRRSTPTIGPPRGFPPPAADEGRTRSVTLPVAVGGAPVFGALEADALGLLDEVDVAFVDTVCAQLAVAFDRRRHSRREVRLREQAQTELARERTARAAAELAEHRLALLSDLSERLVTAGPVTPAVVAGLGIPTITDWCLIDALQPSGDLRRDAVGVVLDLTAPTADGPGPWSVLRTGKPLLVAAIDDRFVEALGGGSDGAAALRRAGLGACLVVPFVVGATVEAALTFARRAPGGYDAQDLLLVLELCRRAGLAVERERLLATAQAAARARDATLAFVAHDLRAPLATVLLRAGLLLQLADDAGAVREEAETIRRLAWHMERLVSDLVDRAGLDAGRLALHAAPVDIDRLIREGLELLTPLARNRGLTLSRAPGGEGGRVRGDRSRLVQVLSNLVGNAMNATPAGGVLTIRVELGAGEVRVDVSDTGAGIEPGRLARLLEPADGPARQGGLGLVIVRTIVEAHGGRLQAVSDVGRGSTFSFVLPAAAP